MFEDKIEAMNKLPNAVDDSSGFEKRVQRNAKEATATA